MPPPVAAGIAAGGAVLGGAGQIAGAFAGGGTQVTGLELPPELEVQLIENSQLNLQQLEQDLTRVQELETAFTERIGVLEGVINQTIPSEQALGALRDSSARIARSFGGATEELVSQGFLDQDDISDLQELEVLEREEFQDPQLERQITEERARLQQDLIRQGASGAQIAQGLSDFDQRSEEARFRRADELRTGRFGRITGRIETRAGLRAGGFQRALAGGQVVGGAIEQARAGVGGLAQFAEARARAGTEAVRLRSGLRGERLGVSETLGQFDISGRTKDLLRTGEIGPGALPGAQPGAPAGGRTPRGPGVTTPEGIEGARGKFGRLSNEELLRQSQQTITGLRSFSGRVDPNQIQNLRALFGELEKRGI